MVREGDSIGRKAQRLRPDHKAVASKAAHAVPASIPHLLPERESALSCGGTGASCSLALETSRPASTQTGCTA
jgi:hypothetical protein